MGKPAAQLAKRLTGSIEIARDGSATARRSTGTEARGDAATERRQSSVASDPLSEPFRRARLIVEQWNRAQLEASEWNRVRKTRFRIAAVAGPSNRLRNVVFITRKADCAARSTTTDLEIANNGDVKAVSHTFSRYYVFLRYYVINVCPDPTPRNEMQLLAYPPPRIT